MGDREWVDHSLKIGPWVGRVARWAGQNRLLSPPSFLRRDGLQAGEAHFPGRSMQGDQAQYREGHHRCFAWWQELVFQVREMIYHR